MPDGVHQYIVPKWFCQEFHRTRLHGLDRHRHVAVAGDEDDRHVGPIDGDAFLEIEAIEVGKCHVKYQAARRIDSWTGQELLRGRERLRLPTRASDQQFQRFAHRNIVVDEASAPAGDRAPSCRALRYRESDSGSGRRNSTRGTLPPTKMPGPRSRTP